MALDPDSKPPLVLPTYYVTLFGVMVALLNQIGYWSHFNINILEHATIWDVAKFSVLPLATAGVTFVGMLSLGSVVAEYVDPKRTSTRWRVFGVAGIATTILITLFFDDPVAIPTTLAICASLLLTGLLLWAGFDPFTKAIASKNNRDTLLFLVIFLPLMSLALGMQRALKIEHGKAGEIATLPLEILAVHGMTRAEKLIYLGATEGYAFLLVAGKGDVLVLRADAFSGVRLSAVKPAEKVK